MIAYPRYDERGRKLARELIELLIESELKMTDCAPVPVPCLPPDEGEVLDPRWLLEVDRAAKRFAELFPCEAGLTGSRALGNVRGDIDLVFYDERCFNDVYETLSLLRERDYTRPPSEGKWDGLGPWMRAYRKRYTLLEGTWNGTPYSIRLVKFPRSPRRPVKVREAEVVGVVVESSVTTPAIIKLHNGVVLESLRMQHSEVPQGTKIKVRGVIESRVDGTVIALPKGAVMELVTSSRWQ